jgi:hypothetical protein
VGDGLSVSLSFFFDTDSDSDPEMKRFEIASIEVFFFPSAYSKR